MKKNNTRTAHHETVSRHAESLLTATAHIVDDKVAEARNRLKEVMESAKEAVEYVEEKAVQTAKQADEFVREKPYHAMGIAAAFGILIGFCLGRRK